MTESSPRAIIGVTAFYMCSALVMIMTNKWVLNTSSLPLTFLLVQLTLSFVCLTVLSFLPPTHKFHFAPPRWNRQTIVAMVPVCTVNVVGLVFNTYCLQIVDASYFQVARGLTLPMTVVLQSVMNSEKPSTGTIVSCGLVTWGFTYSFLPHPHFAQSPIIEAASTAASRGEAPMLGMILGVFSAAMVAVHAVLIKSALKSIDNKTLDLAYWQNVLSALVLVVPVLLFGEFQGLMAMITGGPGAEVYGDLSAFITGSLVTGIVGFLICVAGLLSIKVTSPVTHMFSSAVRSVLQTLLGAWIFKDIINANRVMSILLILAGSCLYTYLRSRSFGSTPPPAPKAKFDEEKAMREALLDKDAEKA